jgi:hypothetical protein
MALHARTSVEMVCFVVRSELEQYNKPFFFATSQHVESFFNTVLNTNLADLSLRLEAFVLSGIQGACSMSSIYVPVFTRALQA